DPALAPQALDDERGPHGDRVRGDARAARVRIEHEQLVSETAETLQQAIELSRRAQVIEPAQAMEHALDLAAIDAFVFDEQEVRAVAVGLGADEHGCRVSPNDSESIRIQRRNRPSLWLFRDTTFHIRRDVTEPNC